MRRIEGLDGLRAIAVVSVMAFHLEIPGLFNGGFLGVDIFFVISGFLITSIMIAELERTGSIALGDFYLKRARRLLPTLFFVVAACILFSVSFTPDAIVNLKQDVPPGLLFYSNYWQLVSEQPYFEKYGRPHALQHLWSLSIEEQFYLAWPLFLVLVSKSTKEKLFGWLTGLLALASAAWMWWLADSYGIPSTSNPERLYLGTDTHSVGLLLGSCLACTNRIKPFTGGRSKKVVNIIGGLAALFLGTAICRLSETSEGLYRGGFFAVGLATGAVILAGASKGTTINIVFENFILKAIGKRSYGLYLWHWPVFVFLRPGEELSDNLAIGFFFRLALTILLTEISYRLVEEPLRKDKITLPLYANVGYGVISCIMVGSLATLYWPNIHSDTESERTVAESIAMPSPMVDSIDLHSPNVANSNDGKLVHLAGEEPLRVPQDNPLSGCIMAFGDSVMLGAKTELERAAPCVRVNATVGRQGGDLLKTVQALRSPGQISEIVVIHIGTNGYIYESNLRGILEAIPKDREVVLINIHASRRWTADNNMLIGKVKAAHPEVTLIDWERESRSHPEYFVKDGVHLTGSGINAYVRLIKDSLAMIVSQKATRSNSAKVEKSLMAETEMAGFSQISSDSQLGPEAEP